MAPWCAEAGTTSTADRAHMPPPLPAFRSKSLFIGGGNVGSVGDRKSPNPGDCKSCDALLWFLFLVFSTSPPLFPAALRGGMMGTVSRATAHTVSVKSGIEKLRTYSSRTGGTPVGDTPSRKKRYAGMGGDGVTDCLGLTCRRRLRLFDQSRQASAEATSPASAIAHRSIRAIANPPIRFVGFFS